VPLRRPNHHADRSANSPTFAGDGFELVEPVLDDRQCAFLLDRIAGLSLHSAGSRCLLSFEWCAGLAEQLRKHPELRQLLPRDHVAVQCTLFEKSRDRNWLVPIHQDLSIPVAEKIDHPDLRGWAVKEGSVFVQPPVAVLEQLVAVRVHLDSCGESDGPLLVVPGTHRSGRIADDVAVQLRRRIAPFCCTLRGGGALVMHPLLLHQSSKATGTSLRRVLHFLFGSKQLPCGLTWNVSV